MNIHTLKLPSAVSSGIRLTTTALTHTHTQHYTPLHLIHPELLTPAEVGQWVYSSLAGLQRRWHTPWLRPGPAPLSSPPHCKYFPSQNENQTPGPARAQTAKKDVECQPRKCTAERHVWEKRQKDERPNMCGTQKLGRRDVSGNILCAEFTHTHTDHFTPSVSFLPLNVSTFPLYLLYFLLSNPRLTFGLPHLSLLWFLQQRF